MSWGRVEHGWEGHAQLVEGSGARPGARRALWLRSFWGQAPVGSRAWGGDGRLEGLSVISKEAGRSQQRLGVPHWEVTEQLREQWSSGRREGDSKN